MKVTKLEHSTLMVEDGDAALVIDPGVLTAPFDVDNLVGIVLTHEHPDHWTNDHLERLTAARPGVPILGPEGVARAVKDFDIRIVHQGDTVHLDPFTLRFFGGTHAQIHASIPFVDNVGVLVNERLYYAGDSYAEPDVPVELLAVPAGAPWLKIGEVMDYVMHVAPRRTIAVHEGALSEFGLKMSHDRIRWAVEQGGGTHSPLGPGESVELDGVTTVAQGAAEAPREPDQVAHVPIPEATGDGRR